jgi:hypothetical protein
MDKKIKRAKITPIGLAHIMKRALEYPHIQRTKLAELLQLELEGKGEDMPEVEVLERKISWFRKHRNSDDAKDMPWDIGTLDGYPLQAEALPMVLQAWYFSEEYEPHWTLTVRQAIWASRLYPFYKDPGDLCVAARIFADEEITVELLKIKNGMRRFTVDLYEKASGEILTEQLKDTIAKREPVTAWGLQKTKRFLRGPVEVVQDGKVAFEIDPKAQQ